MKKKKVIFALLLIVILAAFSFLASSLPDGLERVAKNQGFSKKAASWFNSPLREYLTPGIKNPFFSGALAGGLGVLAVFILALGLGSLLKRKQN